MLVELIQWNVQQGNTLKVTCKLIETLGGEVVECGCVINSIRSKVGFLMCSHAIDRRNGACIHRDNRSALQDTLQNIPVYGLLSM